MKKYLKMNHNNNQLSLGNTCDIIKKLSKNKLLATQTNIFCAIFNLEDANESTVNSYCSGYRSIGITYKNFYSEIKNQKKSIIPVLNNILKIIENTYLTKNNLSQKELNQNKNLQLLSQKLYNLAKNDQSITSNDKNNFYKLFNKNNYLEFLTEILIYITLEKQQPVYLEDIVNNTIENLLNKTNISLNDLENFLQLQFNDGLNYNYSLKKLAKENNPYANFELGLMEYKGEISQTPNYEKSYFYLKKAATANHPRANYLIAKMLLEGLIGTKSKKDITLAYNHLKIAEKLDNIASLNQLGLYYQNIKKDIKTAKKYFQKAASNNYPYAFNNLGILEEKEKNYQQALQYYQKSASLEESWSLNKVAEYYRLGIACPKNLEKAFTYYTKSLNVPKKLQNNYAKYNLAKYFYLNGCYEIGLEKNIPKALELLEDASSNDLLEADIELLTYYTKSYFKKEKNTTLEKINNLLLKIENNPHYNKEIKEKIEKSIQNIKQKEKINRNLFKD